MQIALCTGPDRIEVEERPVPALSAGKVLVNVSLCGICGSDIAIWRGVTEKKYPCSPGHEFCGVISGVGDTVVGPALGQRVVVNPNLGCGECVYCVQGKDNLCDALKTRPVKSNGGLAEYVLLDSRMVYPLPDELEDKLAPFIEPLSCAIHAVDIAAGASIHSAVIFGAGTMGILAGIAMSEFCDTMTFVEPVQSRRKVVTEMFGCASIDPMAAAGGAYVGAFDVGVECSGNSRAAAQAPSMLRKGGRLVLAGMIHNTDNLPFPLLDVTTRELEVYGTWLNPGTFDRSIRLACAHHDKLRRLSTQAFGLDSIDAAFQHAERGVVNKVIVKLET